jgi:hypothetical protein
MRLLKKSSTRSSSKTIPRKKRKSSGCCSFQKLGILLVVALIGYFGLLWSTLATWAKEASSTQQQQKQQDNTEIPKPSKNGKSGKRKEGETTTTTTTTLNMPNTKKKTTANPKTKQQQQQQVQKSYPEDDPDRIIGIASTITNCGPDPFTEGAAVLKYSIDLTSAAHAAAHGGGGSSSSGSSGSGGGGAYNYRFYILGFELLERPTPVNVSDIQGDILRERIVTNGCCGERELIKLEAYRLVQHKVVIHLDLDVLVLQPMDPIIDFILDPSSFQKTQNNNDTEKLLREVPIMWPEKPIPDDIQLLFTKDYNVVAPRRKDKPFQGGFFVVKPSLVAYNLMVKTVLEGDYRDGGHGGKGWGGVVGPFHGGMTIQGLLPWFYENLVPGYAVELNRCVYNNIADNPTTERSNHDEAIGKCRTNEKVSTRSYCTCTCTCTCTGTVAAACFFAVCRVLCVVCTSTPVVFCPKR